MPSQVCSYLDHGCQNESQESEFDTLSVVCLLSTVSRGVDEIYRWQEFDSTGGKCLHGPTCACIKHLLRNKPNSIGVWCKLVRHDVIQIHGCGKAMSEFYGSLFYTWWHQSQCKMCASYQRDNVTEDLGQLPFQCEMYTNGYFWSLSRIGFSSKKKWSLGKDQIRPSTAKRHKNRQLQMQSLPAWMAKMAMVIRD